MEIISFNSLPSTQQYLIEKIKKNELQAPVAVITSIQSDGIGSRDNKWEGVKDNFFVSFAIDLEDLPKDLSILSASIYFSYIIKKVLCEHGCRIWLKWPNDIYFDDNKVGGTITKKINSTLVCGIGINLNYAPDGYKNLQCDISSIKLLKIYLEEVEKYPTWKQIFSEYEIEFELSRGFCVHIANHKKSLKSSILCKDGSLIIDDKKVYSLR